ncbi:MAG TPA: GNAT family N-acetyltransferase [Gaiellaceae bacterium]|nr:GNAT family N-acetyltransferase [Gaiellaceae bacterium]
MFDRQPRLTGEAVELRPLRADDYDALRAAASDPLTWEQHPANRHEEPVFRAYFDEQLGSGGGLAIVDRATGEAIGSSRYHGHDEARSEVEIGWTFLDRRYWGGETNREVKRLMLEHAFRFVETVVFVVHPGNVRSRRAVEKLGAARVADRDGNCVYALTRAVRPPRR